MPRGVYDRGAARSSSSTRSADPNTLAGKLAACRERATRADRLEVKAKALRKKADAAAMEAGAARDALAEKMRELSAGV